MTVERKKDGTISIIGKHGSTSIGRVVQVSEGIGEEKFKQWIDDCAKLVTPNAHTLQETELYFLGMCDSLPVEPGDYRLKSFMHNIIMNHFKNQLEHKLSSKFSFDMTDEEMEKWHDEQNAIRDEVMNSSPERFGLKLRGYYLPHTERNEAFYEQARLGMEKHHAEMKKHYPETQINHNKNTHKKTELPEICFFFEETAGQFQPYGYADFLMKELIVFKGISAEDIEKRTTQFLMYICALRDMGKLPGAQ